MSLASVCHSLALLVGVQPAEVWAPNTEVNAAEIVAWVNEAQARVAAEHDWQALLRDFSAPITMDEQAFALPADFARLVPNGLWLAEARWRAMGPLSPELWERERRSKVASVRPLFTVAEGKLLLRTANIGDRLTGRYYARVPDLLRDADVTALGAALERVVVLCAVALYRDAKGLPAGNATAQYQSALSLARARDVPTGVLGMGGGTADGGMGAIARGVGLVLDVGVLG